MNKKMSKMRENTRTLLPFIAPYKWPIALAIVMVAITCIAITLAPTIEGSITSQLAKDVSEMAQGIEGAGVKFDIILQTGMMLLAIYIVKTLAQTVEIFLLTDAIQNAMHDLRNALQEKVHRLPIQYFDTNQFGDVLSRITNDVDSISNALQQSFIQVVSGILMLAFSIAMMFSINAQMAVIAIMIIPLSLLITQVVVKRSQKRFRAQQDALGRLNGAITEKYSGFNEILLYNRQAQSVVEFNGINMELQANAFKAQFVSSLIQPLIALCTYLTIGAIAVVGAMNAISGAIYIGQLQAFIRYIWQINDPLSQVSSLSSQIQSAFAAMGRIVDILNEPEEVAEAMQPKSVEHIKGNVSFKDVQFGYHEEAIIKNFNVDIKAGQMVAIVGPTGAGKTTLINLLERFYDVKGGAITVDGIDIRDMTRFDLRSIFAMVLQDTWLFSGTIYDNIRYGRMDARKDEVIEAAKRANVHHFIRTLPDGYDMVLNEEGNNISQGEKQLLTIARAFLKDPEILILDEATSSVDTRLEKMLQEAMHNVMQGRTSFVIAHRLSTIKSADVILVIQDGNIVEQGNHGELMKRNGFYAQLYNAQFAHGLDEELGD